MELGIYTVSQKQYTRLLVITSANLDRFTKLFPCQSLEEILYKSIVKGLHLTLIMFLHYLVKLENYNRCRFQWRIARETSEFILQI